MDGGQPGLAVGLGKGGCDPRILLLCKTWVALGVHRSVPALSLEEKPCRLWWDRVPLSHALPCCWQQLRSTLLGDVLCLSFCIFFFFLANQIN